MRSGGSRTQCEHWKSEHRRVRPSGNQDNGPGVSQLRPRSPGDDQGFPHALDQSWLLTPRSVKRTGQPDRMIEASCEPAADTITVPEVIVETERVWTEELRYTHFEAHAVIHHDYDVSLDFVTLSEPGSF